MERETFKTGIARKIRNAVIKMEIHRRKEEIMGINGKKIKKREITKG